MSYSSTKEANAVVDIPKWCILYLYLCILYIYIYTHIYLCLYVSNLVPSKHF